MKSAPISELPLVLIVGVLFDVQSMVYFLLPFHLLSLLPPLYKQKHLPKIAFLFYLFGNGLMILLNLIDLEFYKIKSRRSGIELFSLIADKSNPVLSYIVNYWWLLLVLIAFIYFLYKSYPNKQTVISSIKPIQWAPIFMLMAGLLLLGARGGLYIKPLRSFDAARFVNPAWVSATINSPTQLITSYSASVPKVPQYYSDAECFDSIKPVQTVKPYFKNDFKPNVVLIILESFGRDYCGFLNKEPRFTPFLDSLSKQSLLFFNAYSSGTTSMESIPAIFSSIPSLMEVPYINSNFQSNKVRGVHHYLSNAGYDCSFYYGAENGSMGFDNFLKISGKIEYFGLREYYQTQSKSDFDGHWGIWDEPYLKYYANQLDKKPQPFFSSVFTLTSHDPYNIPDKYQAVFKGGHLPIYKSVQYTDHALRNFFKSASEKAWFKNTVFIITADHPSHSVNEYYYTPTGKFEIPLMIYAPGLIQAGIRDDITASHPDIMATILSLAGIKERFYSFGCNLLDSSKRTSINLSDGLPQLIDYPYCIRLYPDGSVKMYAQPKYTPNTGIRWQLNPDELKLRNELEKSLKMKLQLYFRSLTDNRFNTDIKAGSR